MKSKLLHSLRLKRPKPKAMQFVVAIKFDDGTPDGVTELFGFNDKASAEGFAADSRSIGAEVIIGEPAMKLVPATEDGST